MDNKFAEGRKNLITTGLLALAAVTIGRIIPACTHLGKTASGKKVKMLTADGKLVEVDRSFIKKGKKASGKDIQAFMQTPKETLR